MPSDSDETDTEGETPDYGTIETEDWSQPRLLEPQDAPLDVPGPGDLPDDRPTGPFNRQEATTFGFAAHDAADDDTRTPAERLDDPDGPVDRFPPVPTIHTNRRTSRRHTITPAHGDPLLLERIEADFYNPTDSAVTPTPQFDVRYVAGTDSDGNPVTVSLWGEEKSIEIDVPAGATATVAINGAGNTYQPDYVGPDRTPLRPDGSSGVPDTTPLRLLADTTLLVTGGGQCSVDASRIVTRQPQVRTELLATGALVTRDSTGTVRRVIDLGGSGVDYPDGMSASGVRLRLQTRLPDDPRVGDKRYFDQHVVAQGEDRGEYRYDGGDAGPANNGWSFLG